MSSCEAHFIAYVMSEPLRRKKVEIMPRGDNPNSRKNLKTFDTRSKEEVREINARGGRASGETRRRRKTLREELLALLEDEKIQESMALALVQESIKGNSSGSVVRAFESIRDTIGEKPTEKIAVSTLNEDSISKLQDAIKKRRKK